MERARLAIWAGGLLGLSIAGCAAEGRPPAQDANALESTRAAAHSENRDREAQERSVVAEESKTVAERTRAAEQELADTTEKLKSVQEREASAAAAMPRVNSRHRGTPVMDAMTGAQAAPKVSVETMQRWCTWGWENTLNGTRVQFSGRRIQVTPGVEPYVECKPDTPKGVEAAVIQMMRPASHGTALTIEQVFDNLASQRGGTSGH